MDGTAIVEVRGVGYEVHVPLGTLGRLPAPPTEVTLHVHTLAREDALILFGFATAEDKHTFRTLLGVSGIGAKLALSILSSLSSAELAAAIASGDTKRLKGISGVGKKTIDRLFLELKDKLGGLLKGPLPSSGEAGAVAGAASAGPSRTSQAGQLIEALVAMGWKSPVAERAVAQLPKVEERPLDVLLKEALGHLS